MTVSLRRGGRHDFAQSDSEVGLHALGQPLLTKSESAPRERLEVRCCCEADKVLGSLPVPPNIYGEEATIYDEFKSGRRGAHRYDSIAVFTEPTGLHEGRLAVSVVVPSWLAPSTRARTLDTATAPDSSRP